jgi:hypothetical protein
MRNRAVVSSLGLRRRPNPVVLQSSLVILILASALLWWRQHSARQENAVLRAELAKLRGRLRAARQ